MNTPHTETPITSDWLSTLLQQDAGCVTELASNHDAAFVVQVMNRLEADAVHTSSSVKHASSTHLRWLLLGFQGLVVVFLCMAAPAMTQAWLSIAQSPLDGTAWHNPNLWGFVLSLTMLIYGVHELMNLPDGHGH